MTRKFCEMRVLGIVGIVLILTGCVGRGQKAAGNLDNALNNLTTQIVESMTGSGKKKVAVVEFSDVDGKVTQFGKYLAEELITRLSIAKKFEVVILEGHKLPEISISGNLTDLSSLLGFDAIISGTIIDLDTGLKVNVHIISIDTGEVIGVAATEIVKNKIVRKLMSRVSTKEKC